jgi:anti-sigma factor RsiW
MSETHERVPDWLLERLAAGDLPQAQAAELRSRLEASGECDRLLQIDLSNRAILAAHPPARVASEVARRLPRFARGERGAPLPGFGLPVLTLGSVAALVLGFLSLRGGPELQAGSAEESVGAERAPLETVTEKGLAPQLLVYKSTPRGAERLTPASSVRAGDTLQVAYVAAGQRYGVVASVDAAATVTLHLPEKPGMASALEAEGETALPYAFELDATPGFERFVFVSGRAPFSTASAVEALRLGAPPLSSELHVTELVLRKAGQ